jgi:hypothetical protein
LNPGSDEFVPPVPRSGDVPRGIVGAEADDGAAIACGAAVRAVDDGAAPEGAAYGERGAAGGAYLETGIGAAGCCEATGAIVTRLEIKPSTTIESGRAPTTERIAVPP